MKIKLGNSFLFFLPGLKISIFRIQLDKERVKCTPEVPENND
jgi:hypothetical protein